jgi:hypothetical protein
MPVSRSGRIAELKAQILSVGQAFVLPEQDEARGTRGGEGRAKKRDPSDL